MSLKSGGRVINAEARSARCTSSLFQQGMSSRQPAEQRVKQYAWGFRVTEFLGSAYGDALS
jgi:hypothetical protein